jgi:Protease inhibitor Inh
MQIRDWGKRITMSAAALLALASLTACASNERFGGPPPETAATAAPAPPSPAQPPPVDLAGRWRLSAAGGSACVMTFGATPGAMEGSIAPAGGCPGSFFTSRKWTFEHDKLVLRDHKGEVLSELGFTNGHFEGHGPGGVAISLTR